MTSRILYFVPADDKLRTLIEGEKPEGFIVDYLDSDDPAELAAKLAEAEVIMVGARRLTEADVAAAPKLRLVLHQGVGYHDTVATKAIRDRQIPLAITPGGTPEGVAEHALMMMLATGRRLAFQDSELRAGRWHSNTFRAEARGLGGSRVGIVGLGRIGKQVAKRLVPFDCEVVYHDLLDMDPAVEHDLRVTRVSFEELVATSDFITLHLPLTELSHHMIDAPQLAAMKPGAILINCARGPVVAEPALLEALESGHLGGAGLDVFEIEPVVGPSPFAKFRNVVLTPHNAPGTQDIMRRKFREMFANAVRFAGGESLENKIDL
ncbi:2-hydroxyacid dehydrogenase [Thalassobaculum litoreum]|uniref:Glyoxylate reductase n=1 Tax=Thalassobaculum litoreum DSM 18839 TaxID=1123362 RepID=A0A8G2BLN5_9PROT|nr:2-hydroxyacid dehydrogenase [Thalassobaculum litoreum]SDG42936.1 glyoxylate reductase [Thalassobaculum litoreum DSM 18839]